MKKSIVWARNHIGSLLFVLFVYAVVYQVDMQVFPVVDGFFVERIVPAPKGAFIEGTMHKARECRFIEMVAIDDQGRPAFLVFLDEPDTEKNYSRVTGMQRFGPWLINTSPGAKSVSLTVRHHCHFAWDHVTALTTVNF